MDISKLPEEELIFHLITPDGKGKKVKRECLDALLMKVGDRRYQDGSMDGYESGYSHASFNDED